LLRARGLAVPEDLRARIVACSDIPTLDRWIAQAATAGSIEEAVA
jgi:hypothetical protein